MTTLYTIEHRDSAHGFIPFRVHITPHDEEGKRLMFTHRELAEAWVRELVQETQQEYKDGLCPEPISPWDFRIVEIMAESPKAESE